MIDNSAIIPQRTLPLHLSMSGYVWILYLLYHHNQQEMPTGCKHTSIVYTWMLASDAVRSQEEQEDLGPRGGFDAHVEILTKLTSPTCFSHSCAMKHIARLGRSASQYACSKMMRTINIHWKHRKIEKTRNAPPKMANYLLL